VDLPYDPDSVCGGDSVLELMLGQPVHAHLRRVTTQPVTRFRRAARSFFCNRIEVSGRMFLAFVFTPEDTRRGLIPNPGLG